MLPTECTFLFNERQRARFKSGELVTRWRQQYPEILDEDDHRILANPHQRRYHFCEFLAAVLVYEATGYRSIVEKYTTKCHRLKLGLLSQYLPPQIFAWVCARENQLGQPDLFIFDPESRDWCFREVKGPGDTTRPAQAEWTQRLQALLTEQNLSCQRKTGTIWVKQFAA